MNQKSKWKIEKEKVDMKNVNDGIHKEIIDVKKNVNNDI